MKVVLSNYTGTVGKTTAAAHLLSPRMNNAPVFAIETVNETAQDLGVDTKKLRGEQFKELFKKMMMTDDAIIDVGASNIEAFLDGMVKFEDSHLEFDYFLIPVTSGMKEQKETIAMVSTLSDFGIPAERIKLIFNRVSSDVAEEFIPLLNFVKLEPKCIANPLTAIYENELFDLLNVKKMSLAQSLADDTDYRTKAREAQAANDPKLANHYSDLHIIKSLSKSVNRNLDIVFKALFG